MAWNGRNVSILGGKDAEVKDASSSPPNDARDVNVKKASNDGGDADAKQKAAPAPAAAPPLPSVWNGRHQKITSLASVSPPARSPSPSIVSSVVSKNNNPLKELVVISPPKEDATKSAVPKEKEDETTNSTAGSSITKSIDNEDSAAGAAAAVEVKVVTTTTDLSSSEKKGEGNDKSDDGASAGQNNETSNNNRPKNKNKPNNANHVRRSGSNNGKGGARNNNNNSNNPGNSNNNARQNYARGASNSGRRRANNNSNNNADRPLCSFFMRGMCNRGTACTFRHDAAQAPPATCIAAPSSLRRSGSYPHKNGKAPFVPNKRAFDPHKALAIKLAKEAQDKEDRSAFASSSVVKIDAKIIKDETNTEELRSPASDPPFFSIDVECIATGYGSCAKGINDGCGNKGRDGEGVPPGQYNDGSHRYPGRIAVVDGEGNVLADVVVRPPGDGAGVVSYLTPLTGLTPALCLGSDAKPLDEAVGIVKALLSPDAVLVGQAIDHDVEWLGLVPGRDFGRRVDISDIFRQRMPSVLGRAAAALKAREEGGSATAAEVAGDPSSDERLGFATRYRHFSLRHVCVNLLDEDIQNGVHDPVVDARYSLMLFHKYRNSSVTQLRIVRDGLHRAPITPSFASENSPVVDGVCVSAAAYPYKRAARKIWRWYEGKKKETTTIEQ